MTTWLDIFISWLYARRLYGPRCPDFEPTCHCCRQWADHDDLVSFLRGSSAS